MTAQWLLWQTANSKGNFYCLSWAVCMSSSKPLVLNSLFVVPVLSASKEIRFKNRSERRWTCWRIKWLRWTRTVKHRLSWWRNLRREKRRYRMQWYAINLCPDYTNAFSFKHGCSLVRFHQSSILKQYNTIYWSILPQGFFRINLHVIMKRSNEKYLITIKHHCRKINSCIS